jgi:hypothetical protein
MAVLCQWLQPTESENLALIRQEISLLNLVRLSKLAELDC